jgi:hypothetical protein
MREQLDFADLSGPASRIVSELALRFVASPAAYLFESEIQGEMLSLLRADLEHNQAHEIAPRAKHYCDRLGESGFSTVRAEYPSSTRFDLALIQGPLDRERPLWNQVPRVGVELKLWQIRRDGRRRQRGPRQACRARAALQTAGPSVYGPCVGLRSSQARIVSMTEAAPARGTQRPATVARRRLRRIFRAARRRWSRADQPLRSRRIGVATHRAIGSPPSSRCDLGWGRCGDWRGSDPARAARNRLSVRLQVQQPIGCMARSGLT